jgi:hypothetical protein
MRTRGPRGVSLLVRVLLFALAASCALSACIFIVSTGPTGFDDATLVFVVRDDGGAFVARVHVTVAGIDDRWSADGFTGADGSYRCHVKAGVGTVRVSIDPPDGYASGPGWPRTVDVQATEDPIDVLIRHEGTR